MNVAVLILVLIIIIIVAVYLYKKFKPKSRVEQCIEKSIPIFKNCFSSCMFDGNNPCMVNKNSSYKECEKKCNKICFDKLEKSMHRTFC
ncbi:MAG: hypothetical protein Satyrvirus10_12 [Satyrvirus sp.]|uniref:Uncharacterized protein n=1 Tax=Satyrvirus sp. TaxID=2487771 RepID=A0A3G5AG94_9VIRU|nr:MAG: hypothetical protein Satyrvirus10_12 [Satyrvirus sp.]